MSKIHMKEAASYPTLRNYLYHRSGEFSLEKAIQIKDQYLPPIIYKYLQCTERNIEYFRKDLLYCVSPAQFKDMYDNFLLPNLRLFIQECVDRIIESGQEEQSMVQKLNIYKKEMLNSSDPIAYFASIFSKNKEMTVRKLQGTINMLANEIKRMAYRGLRICCFSQTIESASLWTQRANEETGFALAYDVPNTARRSNLWPVLYTEPAEMPQFEQEDNAAITTIKILIATVTKSMEWEYEQEWRTIIQECYLHEDRYIHASPVGIYLGARINKENREKLLSLAQKKGIDAFMMRPVNLQHSENS